MMAKMMKLYVASLLAPPGHEASPDQKIDFLQQQLDSYDQHTPIFEDFVLLGGGLNDRRQGGAPLDFSLRIRCMLNMHHKSAFVMFIQYAVVSVDIQVNYM